MRVNSVNYSPLFRASFPSATRDRSVLDKQSWIYMNLPRPESDRVYEVKLHKNKKLSPQAMYSSAICNAAEGINNRNFFSNIISKYLETGNFDKNSLIDDSENSQITSVDRTGDFENGDFRIRHFYYRYNNGVVIRTAEIKNFNVDTVSQMDNLTGRIQKYKYDENGKLQYCITDYKHVGSALYPEYYFRYDEDQSPIYAVYDCAIEDDEISEPEELYVFTNNPNAFKTKEVDSPVFKRVKTHYIQ